MLAENSSTLKIMALGRPFQLGMLYDLRDERLIPSMTLWNSELISTSIQYGSSPFSSSEIHTDDTFTKKADLLGMDANLTMNALTGLVELSRSGELINDRRTTEHVRRYILKYSVTTRLHQLTMTHLNKSNASHQEVFDQQMATHVVTDILYGAEVYLVFSRTLFNDENHEKVDRAVMKLLEKMTTLRLSGNGQLNLEDHEKQIAQLLTCQYYGDFDLDSNPTTLKQAAELFKELPKLLGENQENTVPKQIWIYPLHLLDRFNLRANKIHRINNELVNKSLKLIERLHRLEITINDLKNSLPPSILLHQSEQQLSINYNRIRAFETGMKKKVKKLLPQIRGGDIEETVLANLLETHDSFSINKKKLGNWIQFQTEAVRILVDLLNDLEKQVNINISDLSLFERPNDSNRKFILCLIIHITQKNDPFLKEMFEYLNDEINRPNDRYTSIECRFHRDDLELIRNKVALFSEFAERNNTKQNVEFMAEEQYADEFQMTKGVSIILYQDGAPINFEIPSKPGRPRAIEISRRNVTLSWERPTDGSQSVGQYKIYGQISTDTEWTLVLTTTDATRSAVISNLVKGKYIFKIQGITVIGDTSQSDVSDVIDTEATLTVVPVPRPIIVAPSPVVTPNKITNEEATLDVTPAWFEPIKPVTPDKIRLPKTYNKESPVDVRTYDCLSTYRSMTEKTAKIDFVEKPFSSAVDDSETLVVVLNELAHQLGARLTFTNADFKYDDSDYRTACGVTNLGSIHSFLASEGNFQTAKFNLHLRVDYANITASNEALKKFVLTAINDIASIAQCNKDFVRVFTVTRASSAMVGIGITTRDIGGTKQVAELFKQELNQPSITKRHDIFQYLFLEEYDYKLEPALTFLQLQQSDFEPSYNREYRNAFEEKRGGHPYYFPQGWYRHALKVVDKYPEDKAWLRMDNSPGEWAVAYHGTGSGGVRGIADQGLLHSFVTTDVCKAAAMIQNPSIPDVKGLYVATHCEGGASDYTVPFAVKNSDGANKEYRVVFQCRVQPGKFTEHKSPVKVGLAWRVFDEKAIRPYGLLLKSS